MTSQIVYDSVSTNLADQIASQALSLSNTLAQLCLYVRPTDGITLLQSVLKLVPEGEFGPDKYELSVGQTGSIGATNLTNELALSTSYLIRAKLLSYGPLGAEIIHAAAPARSAIDKTVRDILMLDWSTAGWNKQLMPTVAYYQSVVHSISKVSGIFADADEDKNPEKYKQHIRESLIPVCHKIAAQLIRAQLPIIATAKEALLEDASDTVLEFNRLWAVAQMPLFKFALLRSFQNLPSATRELLLNLNELADLRDQLPEIFSSFSAGLKTPKSKAELMSSISDSNHYAPDNFRMVSEFSDLIDFAKEASDFSGLETLIVLNFAELVMSINLVKMDLVQLALELDEAQFAQPLRSFFSALIFTATKLSYSNGQLVNEVRGVDFNSLDA